MTQISYPRLRFERIELRLHDGSWSYAFRETDEVNCVARVGDFELDTLPANPCLRLHHDEEMEGYLNDQLLRTSPWYTLEYVDVAPDTGTRTIYRIGTDTPAVHCRRSGSGQYCDAAIYDSSERLVR